ASYIDSTGLPPEEYLAKFRRRRLDLLAKGADPVYRGRVDTAWSLALDALRTEHAATAELLQIGAFCSPEPMPLALFTAHAVILPAALRRAVEHPETGPDLDDVLGVAVSYSLCRQREDPLQIHRLVQAVIRAQLPEDERKTTVHVLNRMLAAARPGHPDDPSTFPLWAALGPHILHRYDEDLEGDSGDLEDLVRDYCWYLFVRSEIPAASELSRRL